jgi:hypothetical protein
VRIRELAGGLITLFLISGSALAAPIPTGRIAGRVIDAVTRKPIAFANVSLVEYSLGATTGEDGRFSISVPARSLGVLVTFTGYHTFRVRLDVQAGDSSWVEIPLSPNRREEPARVIPVPAPDSTIVNRIRLAREVRLFRLEPMERRLAEVQAPGADRRYLGSWRIRGVPREPNKAWSDSLIRALTDPETYLREDREGVYPCIPVPGVGVRFTHGSTLTDVEICFECGIVFMQSTALRPSGGRLAPASVPLKLLIKQAFPADSAIQALR